MKQSIFVLVALTVLLTSPASADLFLVTTADGPGFTSQDEAAAVLENGIIPTFEALMKMQADKKIVAGGLPIASRRLIMVIDAQSADAVDQMLRDLPAWGVFKWEVTALQSLQGRMNLEKRILKDIKSKDKM